MLNKLSVHVLIFIIIAWLSCSMRLHAQNSSSKIDYSNPKDYVVGGITITGTSKVDKNAVLLLTGLSIGQQVTVPGEDIADAIKNLWEQNLFSDISVSVDRIEGKKIFFTFYLVEQPRLSRYRLEGVSKSEADDIREKINLHKEKIITKNALVSSEHKIKKYLKNKGYLYADVEILQKKDEDFTNHVMLTIKVDKKEKVKIRRILVNGNEELSDGKIRRKMKETKEKSRFRPFYKSGEFLKTTLKTLWKRDYDSAAVLAKNYIPERVKIGIFKTSKYLPSNLKDDKELIINAYKAKGYRDASITNDSISKVNDKLIDLHLTVDEGNKYYFRNIRWIGNTKYSTKRLNQILGIEKGDVYNAELLEMRLFMNPQGADVSSLYMDNGYLFFQVDPIESRVDGDSIDYEMRIYEGQQAIVNDIVITGNTKTNDHVIRREIRSKPGSLFNRSDIMRTQRELATLGYFDPQAMDIQPKPDPETGTVDIEYKVAEQPSDQIELSGGFGGGFVVGTLGLRFSNFSMRNFFNKEAWKPLPSGDGQQLSLRAQTSGSFFQSYNISFTEPWLGGKRPNALTVSAYYSLQSDGSPRRIENADGERVRNPNRQGLNILGVTVGLGRRLHWPDDNFMLQQEIAYQNYDVNNWMTFENFNEGSANNIFYRINLSRNSIDDLNFPTSGSRTVLSAQLTPPYSWFRDEDFTELEPRDRFRWTEYHKWKFTSSWYTKLFDDFVLYSKVGFGGLFRYTNAMGNAPFERFYLGGSGLTGFVLDAREIIAFRGYDDQQVSNRGPIQGNSVGGILINKYTTELRYPFSKNPQAMIYGLTFFEMANTWNDFSDWDPFNVYRSTGVGIRIFLPMFGLLGLDWGYRFDEVPNTTMSKSQIHFTIGHNLGQL